MAHNLEEKNRTEDIQITENVDFEAMLLSENILKGLQKNGFKKPSPIQLKAIPLGRCGFDLIVKAKSGTGKTAVFGITALEMIDLQKPSVQVLILAPAREIAVQIKEVICAIGCELNGLQVEYFIGGTPINEDTVKLQNCHIAVGAPGRVKHLINKNILKISDVRLFVLDEADKLMEASYQKDINWIYKKLKGRKQIITASATYPDELDKFLANYMTSPTHVSPDSQIPVLLGLKQFYCTVKSHLNVVQQMKFKTEILTEVLANLSFNQCLIFSNYQTRAESLSNNLSQQGWPSIFISGLQDQTTRLKAVDDLKKFKCRILSSTDLTSRGIDAANVDLVVNYDVPHDSETYLHRMGRAGRYGSYGICITLLAEGKDVDNFKKIISRLGQNYSVAKLPLEDLKGIWDCDVKNLEQLYGENTEIKMEVDKDNTQEKDLDKIEDKNVLEKACQQLTSLLAKPFAFGDNTEVENMQNISQILQNFDTDKKTDLTDKQIEQESKKQKMDKTQKVEVGTNTTFDIASKSFQENLVLQKNVSLYNLIRYLKEPKENLNEKYVKAVEDLLEYLNIKDSEEKKNYINGFANNEDSCEKLKTEKEEKRIEICDCTQDLFTAAFDFCVSEKEDWRKSVCDKHKINRLDVEEVDEEMPDEWEDEVEYMQETEENNVYINDPTEENLFTQAYDKAIYEDNSSSVDYTHKKFVNFPPHESKKIKRKFTKEVKVSDSYISPELQSFVSRRNCYTNYFQHYSDVLAETAPRFNNLREFHNYFGKWKQELEAVRDFVQQEIYLKECQK